MSVRCSNPIPPHRVCFSYHEAIAATGSSRTSLWRLIKAGALGARTVGERVFITVESLERVFGSRRGNRGQP